MEAVVSGAGIAGLDAHTHISDPSMYSPCPHLSAPRDEPHCTPRPLDLQAVFLERSPDLWDTLGCSRQGVSLRPGPGSAALTQAAWNSGMDALGPWNQNSSTSAGSEENCSWVPESAVPNTCPMEAGTSPAGQTEPVCSAGSRAGAGRRTDSCSLSLGAGNTETARTRRGQAEVSG